MLSRVCLPRRLEATTPAGGTSMTELPESLAAFHAALAARPDLNARVGGADPALAGSFSLTSLRQ